MSLYGISFCYCWIPKKGHELLKHSSLLHCLVFWYIFLIKIFFIPRLRLEKGLCGYEPLSNFWSLFIETQRKICETWWLKLCSWKSKFRKLLWESDDHHCEPCGKWQERWPGNAYICICLWKHIVLPLSPGFLLSCHQYEPCHMQCSPAVGAPRQCLCPAAAAPPAVTLGLPHAPGAVCMLPPLHGELGSCSRDVKWTHVPERAAVTDQLLRKLLEQLLQILADFDFTITTSTI